MSSVLTLGPSLIVIAALIGMRLLLGVSALGGAALLGASILILALLALARGPRGAAPAAALFGFSLSALRTGGFPLGSILLAGMAIGCLLAAPPTHPRTFLAVLPIGLLIIAGELVL